MDFEPTFTPAGFLSYMYLSPFLPYRKIGKPKAQKSLFKHHFKNAQ